MERYHFTIKQKLQILDLVRTGQLYRLASQFPSVTQRQINEWERKENQMGALSEKDQQSKYILHSGPSPMRKELFQFLYQTVKDLRSDRRAVTVDYLISIAETEDPSIQQLSYSGQKKYDPPFYGLL